MSKNYLKDDLERRESVFKKVGVTEEDLKRDVDILRSWGRQQKHLPQVDLENDGFLERLLLNNKFRIEQAKIKMDNYYTLKAHYKVFYKDLSQVKPSEMTAVKIPLRNLSPDDKWVILICGIKNPPKPADLVECMRAKTAITELMDKYCYPIGKIIVVDCVTLKFSSCTNADPIAIVNHLKTIKNCYSGRTSAVHIISAPLWASFMITAVRSMFKGEGATKIKIHDSFESVYKDLPRAMFPVDYGGDDYSVAEYLDIWDDIIQEEKDHLKSLEFKIPDEVLRVGKTNLDLDMFGIDGTFKKLNID